MERTDGSLMESGSNEISGLRGRGYELVDVWETTGDWNVESNKGVCQNRTRETFFHAIDEIATCSLNRKHDVWSNPHFVKKLTADKDVKEQNYSECQQKIGNLVKPSGDLVNIKSILQFISAAFVVIYCRTKCTGQSERNETKC